MVFIDTLSFSLAIHDDVSHLSICKKARIHSSDVERSNAGEGFYARTPPSQIGVYTPINVENF